MHLIANLCCSIFLSHILWLASVLLWKIMCEVSDSVILLLLLTEHGSVDVKGYMNILQVRMDPWIL